MRLVGIFWLLHATPVWFLLLALEFALVDVLWLLRRVFEGWPYNNSLSSEIGDRRLIMAGAGITATILQSGAVRPPEWVTGASYQWAVLALALTAAIVVSARNPSATVADAYHNAVIVPVLIVLICAAAPLIAICGSVFERVAAVACSVCWAGLVKYDGKHGRLKQVQWLHEHGQSRFLN